jgi:hypothetical protein
MLLGMRMLSDRAMTGRGAARRNEVVPASNTLLVRNRR